MKERKKILVIDDNPEQLYIARELLSSDGYEVLTHRSPFGVVGLIGVSQPDLVLLDANMPTFPGIDLAAHLRADDRTRAVPVVLYSSADEKVLSGAVAKHRLRGYIRKGDGAELRRKIAYFLGSHILDAPDFRRRLYAVE